MRTVLVLAVTLGLAACQSEDPVAEAPAAEVPAVEAVGVQPVSATLDAAPSGDGPALTVYKTPTCGCCTAWGEYMEAEGFSVRMEDVTDLAAVKDSLGVPSDLGSCHTGVVTDGGARYLVEGHVPAEHVRRLLDERPAARGLAVPGMPIGSPGMEQGDRRQPYDVLVVDESGEAAVFAHVPGNTAP
jgi:hypothetical protein